MYILEKNGDVRLDRPYHGTSFPLRVETGNLWEDLVVLNLRALGVEAYRPRQTFPKKDKKLYGLLQRDVLLKLSKTRRLVVEVKARRDPWRFPNVLVGDVASFNKKLFTVGAIVIADSLTGDCRVAPAGDMSEWLTVQSKALSYSIPLHLFSPLDAFAQAVLDGAFD